MAKARHRSLQLLEDLPPVSPPADPEQVRSLVTQLLRALGEAPRRNGLLKTPDRVAKALQFMTKGYHQDIDELLNGALFTIKYY